MREGLASAFAMAALALINKSPAKLFGSWLHHSTRALSASSKSGAEAIMLALARYNSDHCLCSRPPCHGSIAIGCPKAPLISHPFWVFGSIVQGPGVYFIRYSSPQ